MINVSRVHRSVFMMFRKQGGGGGGGGSAPRFRQIRQSSYLKSLYMYNKNLGCAACPQTPFIQILDRGL